MVVAPRVAARAAKVAKAVVTGAMGAKAGAVVAMVGAWVAEVAWVASADAVATAAAAGKVLIRASRMAASLPAAAEESSFPPGRTADGGPARRPWWPAEVPVALPARRVA